MKSITEQISDLITVKCRNLDITEFKGDDGEDVPLLYLELEYFEFCPLYRYVEFLGIENGFLRLRDEKTQEIELVPFYELSAKNLLKVLDEIELYKDI